MTTATSSLALKKAGMTLDDIPEPKKPVRPGLPIFYWVVVAILVLPVLVMIAYSFNVAPRDRITTTWTGFTFDNYLQLGQQQTLLSAFLLSIGIALLSGVISIAIGIPLALALERYRFWGKGFVSTMLFLDIAAPSIVVGSATLAFFISLAFPMGFWTILIAHITFNLAYAVVTLRARLSGMGTAYEQAAGDLGARPLGGFFRITLPLLMPGIVASFLLALAMSIDDYVITSFVSGPVVTFPLFVYSLKTGMPPQVLCFGTIVFVVGVALALVNGLLNRRRS